MVRLQEAVTTKPCVSENVKRKLYSCRHMCGHTFYNYLCGYSCIIFFLRFPTRTAWWWLFCVTETCSYYSTCYNKTFLLTNFILIIGCCTSTTGSHTLRSMRHSWLSTEDAGVRIWSFLYLSPQKWTWCTGMWTAEWRCSMRRISPPGFSWPIPLL